MSEAITQDQEQPANWAAKTDKRIDADASTIYQCRFGVDFVLDVESDSWQDNTSCTSTGKSKPEVISESRAMTSEPGANSTVCGSSHIANNIGVTGMTPVDI